jgi:MoaE-MoaD fusion protein
MRIRVRLFAMLRERAGSDELELDLPDGALVADALAQVEHIAGGLPLVVAVNREYVKDDAPLAAGDELALIPPVSGGAPATSRAHARVTSDPLSLDELVRRVADPAAGAIVTFQGVTREVERLDYEAYAEMATDVITGIVTAAVERHGVCAAAAEHRTGSVALGEPSVAVAVSAPHRGEAFAAAREIIDAIKAQAPIWKREVEGESRRWVDGTKPAI